MELCFLMPSKASPAGRSSETENASEPSPVASVLNDMNAGATPDLAANCHRVAAGLSAARKPISQKFAAQRSRPNLTRGHQRPRYDEMK